MGALLLSLSSPGDCFLQHLLAWERGRGCLGTEDPLPKKSRPRHAQSQSVCLSLGNPKSSSSHAHPYLSVPQFLHDSPASPYDSCPPSLHLLPLSHPSWLHHHPD